MSAFGLECFRRLPGTDTPSPNLPCGTQVAGSPGRFYPQHIWQYTPSRWVPFVCDIRRFAVCPRVFQRGRYLCKNNGILDHTLVLDKADLLSRHLTVAAMAYISPFMDSKREGVFTGVCVVVASHRCMCLLITPTLPHRELHLFAQ